MKQNRKGSKKRIVGLTGGIGSGKTTVTHMLTLKGFPVVDADKIAKCVMMESETMKQVVGCFGEKILDSNGEIDRSKLRRIVFGDERELRKLNAIFHDKIRARIEEELRRFEDEDFSVIFLDAPLLMENNLDRMVDEVWLVSCSRQTQIERVMKRDGSNRSEAEQIIDRQMSLEEKKKRADRIIDNETSLEELRESVEKALMEVLECI